MFWMFILNAFHLFWESMLLITHTNNLSINLTTNEGLSLFIVSFFSCPLDLSNLWQANWSWMYLHLVAINWKRYSYLHRTSPSTSSGLAVNPKFFNKYVLPYCLLGCAPPVHGKSNCHHLQLDSHIWHIEAYKQLHTNTYASSLALILSLFPLFSLFFSLLVGQRVYV